MKIRIIVFVLSIVLSPPLMAQSTSDTAKQSQEKKTMLFTKKNGTTFYGKIISENEKELMIDIRGNGVVFLQKSDVMEMTVVKPGELAIAGKPRERQNYRAHTGQNEIAAGRGFISVYLPFLSGITVRQELSTFQFRHHFSRSLTFGVGLGVEVQDGQGSIADFSGSGTIGYKQIHNQYISIVPELTWSYVDRSKQNRALNFKLYGSFAGGWIYKVESESFISSSSYISSESKHSNSSNATLQITPIGLRVGRTVAGYIEFGVGYKGLVNMGVDVRFPCKKVSKG